MDTTIPPNQFFDFDRLSPEAFQQTMIYLRDHSPAADQGEDMLDLLDDALKEGDWLTGEGVQMEVDNGGEIGKAWDWNFEASLCSENSHIECRQWNESSQHEGRLIPLHEPLQDVKSVMESIAKKPLSTTTLSCTWADCQFRDTCGQKLTLHLSMHAETATFEWTSNCTCTWQGCKSRALFSSLILFKTHLKNVHTHPLLCPTTGCKYRKPFRNLSGLKRHRNTAHGKVHCPYECSYASCKADGKCFPRADKWLAHIHNTEHEEDSLCVYHHCRVEQLIGYRREVYYPKGITDGHAFQAREEIKNHFSQCHKIRSDQVLYKCVLGSCSLVTQNDNWSWEVMWEHLLIHHNLWDVDGVRSYSYEIIPEDFSTRLLGLDKSKWKDCEVCSWSLQNPNTLQQNREMGMEPQPSMMMDYTMPDVTGPASLSDV